MDDLAALRLQLDWGADEALDAAARSRLRPDAPPVAPPVAPPIAPPPIAPRVVLTSAGPAPPFAAPDPAPGVAIAAAAMTLDEVHAALASFTQCPLRATATTTIRPSGNPSAGLVLIGEAPGAEDDRSGQAFAGIGGQTLDRVLLSAGLDRTMMLLTTLVPWRPPGNRAPSEAEIRLCLPFLHRLLQLVQPRRLVLLGQTPARTLLGSAEPVRRLRGRWHEATLPGLDAPAPTLTLLPAEQWLRNPASKRETWADLLLLREALGG